MKSNSLNSVVMGSPSISVKCPSVINAKHALQIRVSVGSSIFYGHVSLAKSEVGLSKFYLN